MRTLGILCGLTLVVTGMAHELIPVFVIGMGLIAVGFGYE